MSRTLKIYAGGRIKNTPYMDAASLYLKRLNVWNVDVVECGDAQWHTLSRRPQELWVGLCEKGVLWSSLQFAAHLERWLSEPKCLAFLIGPWDGLPQSVRQQCHVTLSLSAMTWPHLMARVMLLEQLYRAQQRWLNHPYSL